MSAAKRRCQRLVVWPTLTGADFGPTRMGGLEPPLGCPDTDLNCAAGVQMRPPASRSSVLSGFADASNASDDLTVTGGHEAARQSSVRRQLALRTQPVLELIASALLEVDEVGAHCDLVLACRALRRRARA